MQAVAKYVSFVVVTLLAVGSGDVFAQEGRGSGAFAETDTTGGAETTAGEENPGSTATDSGSDTSEALRTSSFRPGTVDVSASVGLGGLIYAAFEPGIDLGLIPISDGVTFSVGGTVGLGYCIFCAGLTALASDFSVSAWNVSPQGRGLLHINAIGESLDIPLDTYVGVSAGPNFYIFSVTSNDVTLRNTVTSFVFTPLMGGRYFPASLDHLFAFGEFRYQTEWAYSTVTLESEKWGTSFVWEDDYARRGIDFVLGGGFRF